MPSAKPTHTITNQGPIIATTVAYMIVKLIKNDDGTFRFESLKSPFNMWLASDERHTSKAKIKEAMQAFIAKTLERDPHLLTKIEGSLGEEVSLL